MEQEKKSVGIITMHRVINYGSALQTYATVKTVEKLGFLPTVIDYDYPTSYHIKYAPVRTNPPNSTMIKKIVKQFLRLIGLLPLVMKIRDNRLPYYSIRIHSFKHFIKQLKISKPYNIKSIQETPPEFDIYMTGSDQTWNPYFLHHDYSFLLNFAPKAAPKISYAASFGGAEFPTEYSEEYGKLLACYDRISVRESSGKRLVYNLCGRNAVHVIDPTLLLNRAEWEKLLTDIPIQNNKFIFCYCLISYYSPAPEIFLLLDHLRTLTNYDVYFFSEVPELNQIAIQYGFRLVCPAGPENFISYISYATFIVTTSFHGSAFSVNFNKNFYAILNPVAFRDDRIKNFLTSIGMESRGLNLKKTDISRINVTDLKIDYRECNQKLEKLRKYSLDYLSEALDFASQKCATKDE